jgi:hypothetical protein
LTLKFGVLELVSSIFGTAGGFFVGSESGDVVELGLGSGDVLLVRGDGKLEVEGFSSEVGNSLVEFGDFSVESTSHGGEGLESLSLSFSFDGEGGFEVLLDVVEDSEESIDHTFVGDSWGSFSDHSNDVEDLSISVGETLISEWLEGFDVGGELVQGGGLDLKESGFFLNLEGFGDDGSGLVHHSSDSGVFGNGGVESVDEFLVLLTEGGEHTFSLAEFSLSVTHFSLSVSENWSVDHFESLVLGDDGFEGVSLSAKAIHFSSAGISDNIVISFGLLSLGSKSFSNFFDHRNNVGNIVFRFELKFNSVGEGFSKISGFDLGEEIGGGPGDGEAKYEDG